MAATEAPEVLRWGVGATSAREIERAVRARLAELGYGASRYVYPPGTRFPPHTHAVDKIDAVVAGRFRMTLGEHEVVLGPGDAVRVPRGAVHEAEVVGDEAVVSLDGEKES